MVCRSSTERSWQLMQLWGPVRATAVHVARVRTTMWSIGGGNRWGESEVLQGQGKTVRPFGHSLLEQRGGFGVMVRPRAVRTRVSGLLSWPCVLALCALSF